jgi:intracellular septation protein
MTASPRKPLLMHWRLVLDWAPLILFFVAAKFYSLYAATAVLMVAVLVTLAIDYARERRVAPVPLITAAMVLMFGALTLYLKDPRFIKMKPTALYALFGFTILGGLAFNRLLLKYVLSDAFALDETGWRKLSVRYAAFFLALAVLNEIVWRNFSQAVWLDFKVFGITVLILAFSLTQTPLIVKHQLAKPEDGEASS